ncbi:hypothetical protein NLG97_g9926 [Lecanicillium saksenae]|uniref:Uncharacterized protein n=1 Tax=Lecanicillium saksenae TaxID=468837 RepID=A0ACC1QH50_9HYPO|nr:hypothetical protein NLG97_g9926 [Lecanicillium saksenae]
MSAVGGSHLHRQPSNSTMRTASTMDTTLSGASSTSTAAATSHIAHMRLPPPTPSRLFGPSAQQQHMASSLLPVPRYVDTPSIAGSTLHGPSLDNDGASSIITFDPADDSDYDQEERRLMPMFGKKRPRSKTGSQKALKVLGMSA